MAFRLTVLLAGLIFVVMYFTEGSDDPTSEPSSVARVNPPDQPAREVAATPEPDRSEPEQQAEAPRAPEPSPPEQRDVPEAAVLATSQQAAQPVLDEQSVDDAVALALQAEQELVAADALVDESLAASTNLAVGLALGQLQGSEAGSALSLANSVRAQLEEAPVQPLRPQPLTASVEEAPVAAEPATATAPPERRAEVIGTSVNLRAGPSTGNSVVGRVSFGDRLTLVGPEEDGWSAVRHPDTGQTVYMASRFLSSLDN